MTAPGYEAGHSTFQMKGFTKLCLERRLSVLAMQQARKDVRAVWAFSRTRKKVVQFPALPDFLQCLSQATQGQIQYRPEVQQRLTCKWDPEALLVPLLG